MNNELIPYKLTNIHAKHSSGYILLPNMLVDVDNQQFIYCRYMLQDVKDVSTSSVDCRLIKTPIKLLDNGDAEVDYADVIAKLNRKNTKKIDYDELSVYFDTIQDKRGKFSVFM